MTNPARYLIRMSLFVALIAGLAGGFFEPLRDAFMGNPAINGVILGAFAIGVIFIFARTLRLMPEHKWLLAASRGITAMRRMPTPSLLAPVALILKDDEARLSRQSLRAMLEGVAIRLDESREISRYMIGLLIFLGLLGTFWGLLTTVQAVGGVVGSINTDSASIEVLMAQIRQGLETPLGGMATAFSSSLFGLAGSLVLGFLDLQLGQASGRFYTDVEDWLGTSVLVKSRMVSEGGGEGGGGEATAEILQDLIRTIAASESDRREMTETLNNIESALTTMTRETRADRGDLKSALTIELRALAMTMNRALDKMGKNAGAAAKATTPATKARQSR